MAKFIQTGQKVNNQINAESIGTVNFGTIKTNSDFANELQKILSELNKETESNNIKSEDSIDIEACIKKAILEAEKPTPSKNKIIENIEGAKKILEGVTTAASLTNVLMNAAQAARNLFL